MVARSTENPNVPSLDLSGKRRLSVYVPNSFLHRNSLWGAELCRMSSIENQSLSLVFRNSLSSF